MKKVFMTLVMGACVAVAGHAQQIQYPEARRCDQVDDYFGTQVADPYRWMEDDTTAEVAQWVAQENSLTQAVLQQIPFRDALRQRLTELTNFEKVSAPAKLHGYYYYSRNNGLQNQYVLYRQKKLGGKDELVLDPNTLSEDGTVALKSKEFNKDGHYLAYSVSRSGSDWEEIYVKDMKTGKLLQDHILWAKFSSPQWYKDGFFYSAYDAPEVGKETSEKNTGHKIYYHRLGTEQSADVLVYARPEHPLRFYTAVVDEDEHYLYIYESGMSSGNNLYRMDCKDFNNPDVKPLLLTPDATYEYNLLATDGKKAYFYTNWGAKNYRVMQADMQHPTSNYWKEFIPEKESVLSGVQLINRHWVVTYMQDACDHAYVLDKEGKLLHEVALPSLGSVSFYGGRKEKEVFYSFSSFTMPNTVYKYDVKKNISQVHAKPSIKFNADDYEVKQVFYPSKDGTRIPMFLVYKKGLLLDGSNPVYLYGYGGFNVSLNPWFSSVRLPFVEQGGIMAVANLRGGGEYGENWHLAGTKMHKQNVFDDFIAAAEYLIREKYTSPEHICIAGGSNGGLLVGAVVNQRPELFRVALPAVGVMDMMRYHKFTIGWNWAPDYGTSEDSKEMADYLLAYSPIHTVKNDGTRYPAILVTTADHDDRVVPAHSFKYAATLQASQTGEYPHLIRIDSKAGHGGGKPLTKVIEEYTDELGFAMWFLKMRWK